MPVLLGAAYLAVLVAVPGTRTAVVVDDLGNLASPLFAGACCLAAARRLQGRLRTTWLLLAGWALTWAAGQAAWCVYEVPLGRTVPFPGLPDVGYVLAVLFAIAALLVHPYAPTLLHGRLRLLTEALLVATGLLALAWRLVLQQAYATAGDLGPAQVLGLGYPVLDVVVVTVLALLVARARPGGRLPLSLVGGSMLLGVAGHFVYGMLAQAGLWTPGNPVDAAWGLGFLLLAAGAAVQRPLPDGPASRLPPTGLRSVLAYAPGMLALVLDAVGALARPVDTVTAVLGILVLATIVLRQVSALLENSRLTGDLEQRTEQLRVLAERDPLTGLPNRTVLYDAITGALSDGPVAVALLDLDGFKTVNDSYGHAAGDELLMVVGARLQQELAVGWTVARLGGDEFAVVLRGITGEAQALAAVRGLLEAISGPAELSEGWVEVTASLGVVVAGPGDDAQALLRNADIAMYAAKEAGRVVGRERREGTARLFAPHLREALLDRLALEAELRLAVTAGDVVPWFQPIVELPSGRVVGVEALARWTRVDGTTVSPAVFVPVAESSGLVSQLGRAILQQACAQAGQWHRAAEAGLLGHAPSLSVNVSAVQLADDGLVADVLAALATSGLPATSLVVEITETTLVQDPVVARARLSALRALGVRIALDDFGTGYSALGALQTMPVDIVKIDRAFVTELHVGAREAAVATAVLTLAGSLGLSVVAEGVELEAQADRLHALGCRLGQGFLWSRAVPASQVPALVAAVPAQRPEAVLS